MSELVSAFLIFILSLISSLLPQLSLNPYEFVEILDTQILSKNSSDDILGDSSATSSATVAKVVDGDTIKLTNGQVVRYIGIDTPETVDPRRGVGCFGKEASAFNKQLVEGKEVELKKDVSDTDKYGRLLRFVYLASDSGKIFVNKTLVKEGYAHATAYPPDISKQEEFESAEKEARENERGLWKSCPIKK